MDIYYDDLEFYNSFIQISIIVVSTIAAFIQAVKSIITVPDNITTLVILCISTYTALVMSISKFFKIDQRKENAHNLRGKYADFHNKIRYRLDVIKAWSEA